MYILSNPTTTFTQELATRTPACTPLKPCLNLPEAPDSCLKHERTFHHWKTGGCIPASRIPLFSFDPLAREGVFRLRLGSLPIRPQEEGEEAS